MAVVLVSVVVVVAVVVKVVAIACENAHVVNSSGKQNLVRWVVVRIQLFWERVVLSNMMPNMRWGVALMIAWGVGG